MSSSLRLSEKSWQRTVTDTADAFGWWWYHPYESRRSEEGWPDLTFLRPPEFFVAELKTEKGRLSKAQTRVIDMLVASGVEVHVWRPSDFLAVETRLRPERTDHATA